VTCQAVDEKYLKIWSIHGGILEFILERPMRTRSRAGAEQSLTHGSEMKSNIL
jgi:hypothetical protein